MVVFEGAGKPFVIQEHVVRSIQPEEILVKNLYTTICGSDLHTYCGVRTEACPTVLGHEIVGRIAEIGTLHSHFDDAGQALRAGDLVTWSVFASDRDSENALHGMPQKGAGLFKYGHALIAGEEIFHGGLAEYCILKKGTAVLKLPEEMPLSIAATINCAIATTAGALRLAGTVQGKTVLITGMGLLGITCAAMCREAGAQKIIAADIDDRRLETALRFGAHEVMNISDTRDRSCIIDVAFDMSGSPDAMEFGLDALTIGGIAVWVGAVFNTRPVQINAEKIIRSLAAIKGLHNYNFEDFRTAVDFMATNWNRYPFATVTTKEFSLLEAREAFEYAIANKPLRAGVRIEHK